MPTFITGFLEICLLGLSLFLLQRLLSKRSPAPLPPGPRGLPIVGNVADMPSESEWLTFAEWGRKWGGICSVKLLGQPLVIVNSAQVMDELDKKGAIYSNRPRLIFAGELVGYDQTLVLMPYGSRFRTFRKHVSRLIGSPASVQQYHPMEEVETHRFLKRVAADPESLEAQLRKTSGAIILQLAYGISIQEKNDPFVSLIEQANNNFSLATAPGAWLVDVFPALRYVPSWFPGSGFKKTARLWAKDVQDMVERPYAFTKQQMASGTAPISFVSSSLEHEDSLTPDEISDIKYTASSLYGAGADTTASAQYAFFLAMLLHPDVQKKAQAEIDAVIGNDRLPRLSDREHLPYVCAVVTEVLRWHNVAPTGVPHTAMEDGVISGYFIPKGSIVIANLWNMLHDPEVYPDPHTFDPTRHIPAPGKEIQRDPRHACFGFARRICVGVNLAEASLFICVAMSLAVFNVSKAVDENGLEITPAHENTSGTISHQKPFKCTIKPRSEKALALIAVDS